jgi:hypothetical protein
VGHYSICLFVGQSVCERHVISIIGITEVSVHSTTLSADIALVILTLPPSVYLLEKTLVSFQTPTDWNLRWNSVSGLYVCVPTIPQQHSLPNSVFHMNMTAAYTDAYLWSGDSKWVPHHPNTLCSQVSRGGMASRYG